MEQGKDRGEQCQLKGKMMLSTKGEACIIDKAGKQRLFLREVSGFG